MSEIHYTPIDPKNADISVALASSPIYAKTTIVTATKVDASRLRAGDYANLGVHPDGNGGYVIDTYVMVEKDGRRIPQREGDSQPINPGDWIVTNPQKQPGDYPNHYAKTNESFHARYEPTGRSCMGIYRAKGLIRLVKNPIGLPIEITAYWGGKQFGDAECYICAPVDRQNLNDLALNGRYLLSQSDFETTYKPVEEVLGPDWRDKI